MEGVKHNMGEMLSEWRSQLSSGKLAAEWEALLDSKLPLAWKQADENVKSAAASGKDVISNAAKAVVDTGSNAAKAVVDSGKNVISSSTDAVSNASETLQLSFERKVDIVAEWVEWVSDREEKKEFHKSLFDVTVFCCLIQMIH